MNIHSQLILDDENMLLGTKAKLLSGVSKIMEQKTLFLYGTCMHDF